MALNNLKRVDMLLNKKTKHIYLFTYVYTHTHNGFELTKKRSRRYPATTITYADYADDIAGGYWQIHLTKPKHFCIVWNEQQQA